MDRLFKRPAFVYKGGGCQEYDELVLKASTFLQKTALEMGPVKEIGTNFSPTVRA
jgi:hypothetical protein